MKLSKHILREDKFLWGLGVEGPAEQYTIHCLPLNTALGALYGRITLHILRTSVHRTLLQT